MRVDKKKLSGTFKEGKRHGLWTWWDEEGQKRIELDYVKGEEVDSEKEAEAE